MKRYFHIATLVLLGIPLVTPALERTELLPPAEASIRVTEAEKLWQEFGAAFGDRLANDRQIQDFAEAFGRKLVKKVEQGEIPLESRHLLEILKLLKGEIAVVYNSAPKGSPLVLDCAFLAAAASREEYGNILHRTEWLNGQTKEDVVRKRYDFGGTELVCDIIERGEPTPREFWMAWVNGTLLAGSRRPWVEKSIVRLKNETVTEPEGSKISCCFPVGQWLRNDLAQMTPDERAESESFWNAVGIMSFEQYLLEIEIKNGDLILDGTLTFSEKGKGLFALLDTAPEDYSDDRIVPGHATSFSYGKLDLTGFWRNMPQMLNSLPPAWNKYFSEWISYFQHHSGLNIDRDFLAHIDKEFALFTAPEGTNQPIVVAFNLNNANALENSFATLQGSSVAMLWQGKVETTDFRNHTIYHKKKEAAESDPFSICVADNHLLLGSSISSIRNTIMQLANPGHRKPSNMQKEVRRIAPAKAFGYGAMDHQTAPAALYVQVSDNQFTAGFAFQNNPEKTKRHLNLSENEISLSHLTSFIGNTYHFAEAVPGGIHHRLVFERLED